MTSITDKHEIKRISNSYFNFMKLKRRGPDRSSFLQFDNVNVGFHRLAIMDVSINGDQPFVIEKDNKQIYTICNGEIYNYKELIEKYQLDTKSGSDCEVIPLLFLKIGMEELLKELIGEYAFTIIITDSNIDAKSSVTMYMARDEFGVRPLFYGYNANSFNVSSELKGLLKYNNRKQFPPRHYGMVKYEHGVISDLQLTEYFNLVPKFFRTDYSQIKIDIRNILTEAVVCRLSADREIGCLLSGGLDSSLIAAIASRILKARGEVLKTFSIGMTGSTDEPFAIKVAEFIGSHHTHIKLDEKEWLTALPHVIYATETFDITTIRASTGQYLAAKKIFELTGIKTLLNGDGSDEEFIGYLYNKNAPSPMDAHLDSIRLLSDIHFFDGLRVDRGIASQGIEARVPFLDRRLVQLVLSVHPELKVPINGVEKSLLRESFNTPEDPYIPLEVLYRQKEAFSDGVSSKEHSWFKIIQDAMDVNYSDEEFQKQQQLFSHCKPVSKEALWYRNLFDKYFGNQEDEEEEEIVRTSTCNTVAQVIPYYWLPRWSGNIQEPSARVLQVYT